MQIRGNISRKIFPPSNISDPPTTPITSLNRGHSYQTTYERSKKGTGTPSTENKVSPTAQCGTKTTSPASEDDSIIIDDSDEETDTLLNSPTQYLLLLISF